MGDIVRRGTAWYVRYKDVDGVRRMKASHQPTRELARRMLVEIEARVARGMVGIPEPATEVPTVRELVDRFLAEYRRPKIKDLTKYRAFATSALRRALPTIGALRADALARSAVNRLCEALRRRCAPGSARITLTFCKTVFAWAKGEGVVTVNPFTNVELPQRQDSVEYLSVDEVKALLTEADRQASDGLPQQMLRVAVYLALRTGMRKGELFGLRWRDLDLKTRRLTVARSFGTVTKSGYQRHLKLPAAMVPILAEWAKVCPSTAEGLVLPRKPMGRRWKMMVYSNDMAGLPKLFAAAGCHPIARAWHALRHTFASHYIMQGGSLLALQKILGHSDVKMTAIYAHLAPEFLGDEMDRLKF